MKILITGTHSGIGKELVKALRKEGHMVIGVDNYPVSDAKTVDYLCDVRNHDDILILHEKLIKDSFIPDVIINNAGVNVLDWVDTLTEEEWDEVMDTNAKSIFLFTQTFIRELVSNKGVMINILSNAADKPMTNSLVYNASKAAAKMMTLQLSRELSPKGVCIFGISPNKISGTAMSDYVDAIVPGLRGWTPEYAREYERQYFPAGEETPISSLVNFIAFILSKKENHRHLAGSIIPYGA